MTVKKKPGGRPRPNRIRELRANGVVLSQKMLAALVGLDVSSVSRHESGDMGLSKDQILAYAAVFNVPSYEIFVKAEKAPPTEEET